MVGTSLDIDDRTEHVTTYGYLHEHLTKNIVLVLLRKYSKLRKYSISVEKKKKAVVIDNIKANA